MDIRNRKEKKALDPSIFEEPEDETESAIEKEEVISQHMRSASGDSEGILVGYEHEHETDDQHKISKNNSPEESETNSPLNNTLTNLQATLREEFIKNVATNPHIEQTLVKLKPAFVQASKVIDILGPYIRLTYINAKAIWNTIPIEIIQALVGLVLCFFGGAFVTVVAAVEAFLLCGGKRALRDMRQIYRDYKRVTRDQKRSASQTNVNASPTEKLLLAMRSVKDPDRLSGNFSSVYTAVLAVFTTLRLHFARTITLGAAIGDMLRPTIQKYCRPSIQAVVEPTYHNWIPVALDWSARFFGISIAWYAQRVVAALQSSLRGALLFTKHSFRFLVRHHVIDSTSEPVEQLAGYLLAVVGFYCQLTWWYVFCCILFVDDQMQFYFCSYFQTKISKQLHSSIST